MTRYRYKSPMGRQASFKCFLKLGKVSEATATQHQLTAEFCIFWTHSQCEQSAVWFVLMRFRTDDCSICRPICTIMNSSHRAYWAATGNLSFRRVMKPPSSDVTFLQCSKLSVHFLTYLLPSLAAMHC